MEINQEIKTNQSEKCERRLNIKAVRLITDEQYLEVIKEVKKRRPAKYKIMQHPYRY